MQAASIVLLTNAALALLERSLPVVDELMKEGHVTPAEQSELLARFESLKTKADGQFSAPHWQIEPNATPPPPTVVVAPSPPDGPGS